MLDDKCGKVLYSFFTPVVSMEGPRYYGEMIFKSNLGVVLQAVVVLNAFIFAQLRRKTRLPLFYGVSFQKGKWCTDNCCFNSFLISLGYFLLLSNCHPLAGITWIISVY